MATILAYSEGTCRQCGQGKALDQQKTAANALAFIDVLKKNNVAKQMNISASYLGDLLAGRRQWNADLAEKFEAAVKALKK
jgi:hypothetical protein